MNARFKLRPLAFRFQEPIESDSSRYKPESWNKRKSIEHPRSEALSKAKVMAWRWPWLLATVFALPTLAAPPKDLPEAYTTYRKHANAPISFVQDPFSEHLERRSAPMLRSRVPSVVGKSESSAAEPAKYIWNALEPVGDWHNESNWIPHGTPGPLDLAIISGLGGSIYVTISADVAVGAFGLGAGCTLNVTKGSMFKFTNRSLVDRNALLYVDSKSTLAMVELHVYGTLNVVGDYRAYPYTLTAGTVVVGINPLPGKAAPVTPTNRINVFGTTNLLGFAGVYYINISNVVIVNHGHLHMGSASNGTFLQIWMLDYMVINNTARGLFDMQQGPADLYVTYYYVLAGWTSVVKVINSGTWILGKIHVSTVNQEHHGPLIWLPGGGMIDGAVLTGSKFTWNFTTPDSGISCAGFVVDVEEWTLIGPGGVQFMMAGLGVQAWTRFHSGRLVAHTEIDLVSVKISRTFDFRTFPDTVVRFLRWDAYGPDNMANEIDTVAFVNHGTLNLDADGMSGKDDLVQLLNGATIVNEAHRVMNWKSKMYNLTVTSPDGSGGYIDNRGNMSITYGWNKYNPPLQVPLVSNGTIRVLSGNFTTGAGLTINRGLPLATSTSTSLSRRALRSPANRGPTSTAPSSQASTAGAEFSGSWTTRWSASRAC
eukprot:TRINITY_DN6663_c0_g2_i1.p2 TRINITY_DN6663_c0_g2~~TRINITY_DN6663_c0_g2_i1.p2  ORF type:complete len:654 (+),score=178.93 TRINITY_DN6663_c0_g2_i1:2476-4437(+)